jgi:hypothetical protein
MYEGWLKLDKTIPREVRIKILEQLRATHCGWANWYLENERYDDAQKEMFKAIGCGFAPRVLAKWALTWFTPRLAKRLSAESKPYL